MRLGRWVLSREHPKEKALRKWGQLTPELRELIARATRSTAKDAIQDIMDQQGLLYDPSKSMQGSINYTDEPSGRHYHTDIMGAINEDLDPQ